MGEGDEAENNNHVVCSVGSQLDKRPGCPPQPPRPSSLSLPLSHPPTPLSLTLSLLFNPSPSIVSIYSVVNPQYINTLFIITICIHMYSSTSNFICTLISYFTLTLHCYTSTQTQSCIHQHNSTHLRVEGRRHRMRVKQPYKLGNRIPKPFM